MIKCQNCGKDLPDGTLFCTECGTKVESKDNTVSSGQNRNESTVSSANTDGEAEVSICPNCGKELSKDVRFCTGCGAKIEANDGTKRVDLKKSKSDPVLSESQKDVDEAAASEQARRCSSCGAEVPEGAQFCVGCGAKVNETELGSRDFAATQSLPDNGAQTDADLPQGSGVICPNCGNAMPMDSLFCTECGSNLGQNGLAAQRITSSARESGKPQDQTNVGQHPVSSPAYSAPKEVPTPRKKSPLRWIIPLVAVAAVVALGMIFWEGSVDYIATVKAWEPYRNSGDVQANVGQVLSKYMPDAYWEKGAQNEGSTSVKASGKVEGVDGQYSITFKVTPDSDNKDTATFAVTSFTRDGAEFGVSPSETLRKMFMAYEADQPSMAEGFATLLAPTPASDPAPAPTRATPVPTVVPVATSTPVPTQAQVTSVPTAQGQTAPAGFDANGFVFADSSQRYLTPDELTALSLEMLGFARNEIFARNGNLFQRDKYINHYTSYDWYNNIPNKRYGIDVEELNPIEKANVALIQEREKALGGPA